MQSGRSGLKKKPGSRVVSTVSDKQSHRVQVITVRSSNADAVKGKQKQTRRRGDMTHEFDLSFVV